MDYATYQSTAQPGSDFVATTGTLRFAPSLLAQSQTITVATTDDASDEADTETFGVNLAAATNATIVGYSNAGAARPGRVTIIDNDGPRPAP